MKRLHTLLYCIYLERNKKTLCIEEGISLYKWVYENGFDTFKIYEYFTNNPLSHQPYSIPELKEILRQWINKN